MTQLTEIGLSSLIHPFAATCSLPHQRPRHLEPQIICNTVKASRCPWSKPQPNQGSLNGLGGNLPVESDTRVNLSRLISVSKGPSSFRWQTTRVRRQKEMKGTPPPAPPTRGFLQQRRKSEMLCLCCPGPRSWHELLKHAARGAALGLKLEI